MNAILTLGLVLATLTAYSQRQEIPTHKDLGFGYDSFPYSSLRDTQSVASPRDLLDIRNRTHKTMVSKFAERFPGQESFMLNPSLFDTFAATRNEAAGVHLFLGSEKGKLQVIMTHTRIDTIKVNETFNHRDSNAISFDAPSNYTVMYDQAYYWNNRKRNWQLVKNTGKLQQRVLNSRRQAQEKYGYSIQGYYFSKDLLLRIRKESGQNSLTVFLGQGEGVFHLILPILSETPSNKPICHYATDYKRTEFSYYKNNLIPSKTNTNQYAISDSYYTASLSKKITSLPQNVTSPLRLAPPPTKDHNTVRTCQPYCNN